MRWTLTSILVAAALSVAPAGATAAQLADGPPPCAADCETLRRAWIELAFLGEGWTTRTTRLVLGDLRADLAPREIDLDLSGEHRGDSEAPIAWIRIASEGHDSVVIQVDVADGASTRRLVRVTRLDTVPKDGRALAIALTADELLRVGWVQIALRRAAENAAAVARARTPRQLSSLPSRAPATISPAEPSPSPSPSPSPMPSPMPLPSSSALPSSSPPSSSPSSPSRQRSGSEPSNRAERPEPPMAAPPILRAPKSETLSESERPSATPSVPPPVPTAVVASSSPASPSARFHLGLSLAAAALAAPPIGTRNTPVAAGASFRLALTGDWLGVSVGAVLPSSATLDLGDAQARARRIAFDAGPRLVVRRRRIALAVDAGLLVVWRRIDGVSLYRSSSSDGFDAGARGALAISFGRWRVTPWIGVSVEAVPTPAAISFAPTGAVGHNPTIWIGGFGGLRLALAGGSAEP